MVLLGMLAGCVTNRAVDEPIGTGNAMDELPASPCACEVFYRNGEWIG